VGVVETRRRAPRREHAGDHELAVFDAEGLSDAVAAPEQTVVGGGVENHDRLRASVGTSVPASAVDKRHLEHREKA
jgi:hypothetical protein